MVGVDHVVDVALLVDDDQRVAEFEDALEGLAEAVHERIRLRLTGRSRRTTSSEGGRWA